MTSTIQDRLFARSQLQAIAEGLLAAQPRNFSLIGAKFMGKTRILTHLASPDGPLLGEDAETPPTLDAVVVYYDCAWPDAKEDLLAFLADGLRRHLQQQNAPLPFDLERIRQEPESKERLRRLVMELKRAGYRPILLLDNFDTLISRAGADMERKINQLRPLIRELGLIVASERPLHEANRELASSPLFNLLNQLFLRLIEPQEVTKILGEVTAGCADQKALVAQLAEWTGGHPFLLSRIDEILQHVIELLPESQILSATHLPLIRSCLTDDYAQLLFGEFWNELQNSTDPRVEGAFKLVTHLLDKPLFVTEIESDSARAFYWLLNQGMVYIEDDVCRIFSPLFKEYVEAQIAQIALKKVRTTPKSATKKKSAMQLPSLQVRDLPDEFDNGIPVDLVLSEDEIKQFTPQERRLLRYFLDRPGEIISINQLLEDVWKRPNASARRVQEGIRRLRNRMEEVQFATGQIENEWGEGYRFVPVSTDPRR